MVAGTRSRFQKRFLGAQLLQTAAQEKSVHSETMGSAASSAGRGFRNGPFWEAPLRRHQVN
jgi:hypothetical protein